MECLFVCSVFCIFPPQKSGWRNEFGNEMSSELLEEIQILNMQFPVHRFFTLLMRKRTAPKEDISALGRKINVFFQEQTTVLSLTSQYLKV